jgi:hypothetical protein
MATRAGGTGAGWYVLVWRPPGGYFARSGYWVRGPYAARDEAVARGLAEQEHPSGVTVRLLRAEIEPSARRDWDAAEELVRSEEG